MLKKLKNNFTKYFCLLMVLFLLAVPLCISVSAYNYDPDITLSMELGSAGVCFGERYRLLGQDFYFLRSNESFSDVVTDLVYRFYYSTDGLNGYKVEFFDILSNMVDDFDYNDYFPVVIIDEFTSNGDSDIDYSYHYISDIYSSEQDIYFEKTGLFNGVNVILMDDRYDGTELNFEGYYGQELGVEFDGEEGVTACYLLIPFESEFFKKWCPYPMVGETELSFSYSLGYEDGVEETKALFDNSYYGLLYNSIGELVYGDVVSLTDTQALVLNFVSMILSLAIIVIPIIVLLLVVKLVMRR